MCGIRVAETETCHICFHDVLYVLSGGCMRCAHGSCEPAGTRTSTTILINLHKIVNNKAGGRIWLCHLPRFMYSACSSLSETFSKAVDDKSEHMNLLDESMCKGVSSQIGYETLNALRSSNVGFVTFFGTRRRSISSMSWILSCGSTPSLNCKEVIILRTVTSRADSLEVAKGIELVFAFVANVLELLSQLGRFHERQEQTYYMLIRRKVSSQTSVSGDSFLYRSSWLADFCCSILSIKIFFRSSSERFGATA
ncbi:hypothetical protein Tco_0418725 [Tanacetum coccineum]